jgi:hypothetical protein
MNKTKQVEVALCQRKILFSAVARMIAHEAPKASAKFSDGGCYWIAKAIKDAWAAQTAKAGNTEPLTARSWISCDDLERIARSLPKAIRELVIDFIKLWRRTMELGQLPEPRPEWIDQTAEIATTPNRKAAKKKKDAPVRDRVAAQMREEIANGILSREKLKKMKQEAMAAQYMANRQTCRQARAIVLSLCR